MSVPVMHYSAILIVARPERLSHCERDIRRSGLAEIHHHDPESGRIIAVLETSTLDEQPEALRRIRELPDVLLAELVYYLRDHRSEINKPSEMA